MSAARAPMAKSRARKTVFTPEVSPSARTGQPYSGRAPFLGNTPSSSPVQNEPIAFRVRGTTV
jgi:hypothetical protein